MIYFKNLRTKTFSLYQQRLCNHTRVYHKRSCTSLHCTCFFFNSCSERGDGMPRAKPDMEVTNKQLIWIVLFFFLFLTNQYKVEYLFLRMYRQLGKNLLTTIVIFSLVFFSWKSTNNYKQRICCSPVHTYKKSRTYWHQS